MMIPTRVNWDSTAAAVLGWPSTPQQQLYIPPTH